MNGKELFKDYMYGLPSDFHEGYATIQNGNGQSGIIDTLGNLVLPFKFVRVNSFQEQLATVACDFWSWGVVNLKGEVIIPCTYDDIGFYFKNGLNRVGKKQEAADCKYALIDTLGKLVTPFLYDELGEEHYSSLTIYKNIMPAKKNGKWGFINTEGKETIPFQYKFVSQFRNDNAVAEVDTLYGMLNLKGDTLVPFTYEFIDIMSDSIYPARRNNKYGFINSQNEIIIPFEYEYVAGFNEGLGFACKNGCCGFINYSNQVIIPFQFEEEGYGPNKFWDGLAWLNYNGVWCYIDMSGKIYKR
ncbi:MAG: WG repeat-containing protein [Bacteroidetes bacterium]|nr:WG repeat-containing protein [Bacteroidota bacterium]